MTPPDALRPIRRSPLESVHAALGARWIDETARWPASYGDAEAERRSRWPRTAGLADIGPVDKVMVRGAKADTALRAARITPIAGSVTAGVAGVQAWRLGEDEVLLLAPASTGPDKAAGMSELAGRLRAGGAAVTDLGSGLSVLRLIGPAVGRGSWSVPAPWTSRREPSPTDASSRRPSPVCGSIVARQDHPDALGYTLLVPRDLAEYLWDALLELGSDLGLVPVGGDVARPGFVGTARATP